MRISLASSLKHQSPEMNRMGTRHTYYQRERCFRICDAASVQGHAGRHTGTHQFTVLQDMPDTNPHSKTSPNKDAKARTGFWGSCWCL